MILKSQLQCCLLKPGHEACLLRQTSIRLEYRRFIEDEKWVIPMLWSNAKHDVREDNHTKSPLRVSCMSPLLGKQTVNLAPRIVVTQFTDSLLAALAQANYANIHRW